MRGTTRLLRLHPDCQPSYRRHRDKGLAEGIVFLFVLAQAVEARDLDGARTDGIDADLAIFQFDRSGAHERSQRSLSCAVNAE
jgi:hypothetical protein